MPYQYPTPSPTATAALSYGPTYSAASPECLTSTQLPLLQPLLLFLTALLTLPLLLNSLTVTKLLLLRPYSSTMIKLLLLRTWLLFLRPYLLCCFSWTPSQWPNSSYYGHCCSSYGPTYSAASPECLNNDPTATAVLLTVLLTLLHTVNDFPWVSCGVRHTTLKVRGVRYVVRSTRYEITRHVIRDTWYMIRGTLVGVVARAQARNGKCTYTVEVASWVRTPLPEVELVGAAKYPLHRFNTIRNELCFVNKCLYCTAARLVKPPPARGGVGGWIHPALLISLI